MNEVRNELRQLIKNIVLEVMSDIRVEIKAELEKEHKVFSGNREEPIVKTADIFEVDKGLVTEKVVLGLLASGCRQLRLAKSVVVTPLAKELMRSKAIHVVKA